MLQEELIIWEQLRKGDQKALALLFEKTADKLYHFGIKFTDDEETVKDCIQELFIKLHTNYSNLPEVRNPLFYLFRSLKNKLLDTLQQKEKIVYFSTQELPFHVKLTYDNPEEEIEDDIKEKFTKVINLLSNRQKEAIYLRFQAEMSYDEISIILGINYQSARNLIHRSIEKIRAEMNIKSFILLLIHI